MRPINYTTKTDTLLNSMQGTNYQQPAHASSCLATQPLEHLSMGYIWSLLQVAQISLIFFLASGRKLISVCTINPYFLHLLWQKLMRLPLAIPFRNIGQSPSPSSVKFWYYHLLPEKETRHSHTMEEEDHVRHIWKRGKNLRGWAAHLHLEDQFSWQEGALEHAANHWAGYNNTLEVGQPNSCHETPLAPALLNHTPGTAGIKTGEAVATRLVQKENPLFVICPTYEYRVIRGWGNTIPIDNSTMVYSLKDLKLP